MKETPFFFPNGSYNLFGVLHEPEIEPNGTGFVFCSPFAEEKLWAHRVFVNFARDLARLGYTVLRFDYMGHGDSDGDFEDSTIETRLSDIKCAIGILKEKEGVIRNVGLLGLRLGATLAALVAKEEPVISHLILWEPIINGASYMKEMLRINLATQTSVYKEIRYNTEALIQMMKDGKTVNVDGYEMSWPLYEQSTGINLRTQQSQYGGPTLLMQISRKKGTMTQPFKSLQNVFRNCEWALAVEEPFWKEIKAYYYRAENLFGQTFQWLER